MQKDAVGDARAPCCYKMITQGNANMEDHEMRRKIIREWMALPKEKRQIEEQVAAFAKKVIQQNEYSS